MDINVNVFVGMVFESIENVDNNKLIFKTTHGKTYKMHHYQDCCEDVYIEDIVGDLSDLIGSPILLAEEATNHLNMKEHSESATWTFYKFSTIKGSVTIRWYGESNGYYSEAVYIEELESE